MNGEGEKAGTTTLALRSMNELLEQSRCGPIQFTGTNDILQCGGSRDDRSTGALWFGVIASDATGRSQRFVTISGQQMYWPVFSALRRSAISRSRAGLL